MEWTPITIQEIYEKVLDAETNLVGELSNFWDLIKIYPEKWDEPHYGKEGNGFWIVAIIGNRVIWYNDIEEGFNVSHYKKYGEINGYYCNQDELIWAIQNLFQLIRFEGDIIGRAAGPEPK